MWYIFVINKRWKRVSALFNILYMCSSCTYFKSFHSSCIQVPQSTMSWAAEDAVPLQLYSFLSILSLKVSFEGYCGRSRQPAPLFTHPNIFFLTSLSKLPSNKDNCFSADVKRNFSCIIFPKKPSSTTLWESLRNVLLLLVSLQGWPTLVFVPEITQHRMEITPFTLHQHTLLVVLAELETAHIRP